ncbi:peptidoglycan-associated lipoprotein Pal [Cochlodiniinecator piscidefendens]|uniref:peptidoglycan-associated lipoprotein Pal n=1 Tax=Cochlodiniinecator piscidefendens TaxID=2715756 RepID=UPI00140BAD98|nr:peptidoglycan-associated lipoprotein Pal [Cochlodiniinecator piscidefendens]
MNLVSKTLLLVAAIGLGACTDPSQYGTGGNGTDYNSTADLNGVNDPSSPAYFRETIGDRVLFAVDQSTLGDGARATLLAQANWLHANPEFDALIEGHADEQGTREYNLALGARRANAVEEYLSSQGIASNRLRVVSFGKERPIEVCSDETCYGQNRRAVTVISAGALTS